MRKYNSNIECFSCNEKGSISRNCPKKDKKKHGMATQDKGPESKNIKVESSFTALINRKGEGSINYWLGDSGATKLM
jgi:hypothetical protein